MDRIDRCRAFTLIELLVVVAIIALLVSILLPTLREAREQGKMAHCLANLKQLNTAAVQYFLDYNDNFPFQVFIGGGYQGICSWSYGGKTASDYWKDGPFYVPIGQRPFNKYLLGRSPEPDLYVNNQLVQRTEVPVLRCASDRNSRQRVFEPGGEQPLSTYDDVGTSYHYNLHALFDVNWHNDTTPWEKPGDWVDIGRDLVRAVLDKFAATYVMFLEDPLDLSIGAHTLELGNHGKFATHCIGALDGHAEYRRLDTRRWCGPGWATIVPAWVRTVDYTPLIYYSPDDKNCDAE